MGDFVSIVTSILAQSERRVEISAQNIANMTTPGYKRRIAFADVLKTGLGETGLFPGIGAAVDFGSGKVLQTKNDYDLALNGRGFFAVEGPGGLLYTRQGEFHRDADGRLAMAQGYLVQADGGGDIALKSGPFTVSTDGQVVQNGEAVAKVAVYDTADPKSLVSVDGGLFAAPDGAMEPVDRPAIQQGALETSNVSTGDEMISIMAAMRQAEAGQHLMGVYDDLMGRALTAFGQA